MRIEDAEHIFEWRYANVAEKYYRSREKPSLDQDVLWLTSLLQNENHHLFIAEQLSRPVSHLKASSDSKRRKLGG